MNVKDGVPYCAACQQLLEVRNKEYGDSVEETGVLGAVIEIQAKAARLRELVLRAPDHGRLHSLQVADSLRDIHNYAVICHLMQVAQNWEGKELP